MDHHLPAANSGGSKETNAYNNNDDEVMFIGRKVAANKRTRQSKLDALSSHQVTRPRQYQSLNQPSFNIKNRRPTAEKE